MHEAFGNLVQQVQDIADAEAAAQELTAKVAERAALNMPEAIERVSADLKGMKADNQALAAAASA